MALQVWLPLTKDLSNQGLSNVTVTNNGATFNSAGKLGGCYVFNGSSKIINTLPTTITSSIGTLSCWVKMNSLPSSSGFYNLMQVGNLGGYATCRFGIYMEYNTRINISIDGSDTNTNAYTHSLSPNTWYHICATNNGTTVKLYLNGVEVLSKTVTRGSYTSAASYVYVGGTSSYYLNGYINDARYYNHALSEMEVKELAKGLVLHWKLDGELPTSQYDSTIYEEPDGSLWTRVFHHNNPANNLFSSSDTFATGVYKNADMWYDFEGICNIIPKWEIMVKQKNTTSSTEVKNRWIQTVNPMKATWSEANTGYTRITTSGYTSGAGRGIYLRSNSHSGNARLTISDGSNGDWWGAAGCWTAYQGGIPAYPSEVCTTGYFDIYLRIDNLKGNDSKEYDCSGFKNNGTYTNNVFVNNKKPKYNNSTFFGVYNTPTLNLDNATNLLSILTNCSISWWEYATTSSSTLIFGGQEYHGNYYIAAGSSTQRLYDRSIGTSGINFYKDGVLQTTTYSSNGEVQHANVFHTPNEWHHYCLTGITFATWTALNINGYGSSWPTNCNMSDVRIYATALSATDVKSLYHNEAYIDSAGTIYGAIR